jgi:hypothetical protein
MTFGMTARATACLTIGFASMLMAGCRAGTAPEPACRVIEHEGTRIGEYGGFVRLDHDDVVLAIPPGAVTGPCGITVSIEPWTDVSTVPWSSARALIGTSYRVRAFDLSERPEKVRLAAPATLTVRYDAASVPTGAPAEELLLAQVTRVGCSPDLSGFGCSWDLAYRSLATSRIDVAAGRLTASLSCLDVCGGSSDGTGDGTGEFLVMHPRCERYGADPADPQWHCDSP